MAIRQIGKRGKAWQDARKELKIRFERWGITTCELRYEGCWNNNALGFAHIDKRRNLDIQAGDLMRVVLACNSCHDKVERLPAEKMRKILEAVIAEREHWLGNKGIL